MAVLTKGEEALKSEQPDRAARRRRRRNFNRREAIAGYLFILPWVIGFLVFTLGAMIYSLVISFSNYDLATDTATPFGFENYRNLIEDPKVLLALGNTLSYAIMAVPLEIAF